MQEDKIKRGTLTKLIWLLPLWLLLATDVQAIQGSSLYREAVQSQRSFFSALADSDSEDIDFGFANDRLEIDLSYDYLNPHGIYGDWTALNFRFYDKIANDLTILYQASAITRVEGGGFLGAIGAYKGWFDRFYTYTQLSAGTDSVYLPTFRLDHEFNYLFGEHKNIVGLLGFTYINQYDEHEDFIVSLGLTYYAADYNLGYRVFFNQSDPGSVKSNTQIISLGVGHEKDQWVYVDVAFGNPAYLSTITSEYQAVENDTVGVYLKYRKWWDEDSGFYAETGFFNLGTEYNKYNFRLGYFKEF